VTTTNPRVVEANLNIFAAANDGWEFLHGDFMFRGLAASTDELNLHLSGPAG
jgi:hypothetical protein